MQNVNILFYCCSSTVVCIFNPQLPPSLPITSPPPRSYPLWLCPCILHICSLVTTPQFPPYSSPPSPFSDSFFSISMSLVIFCLFVCIVDYVPLAGDIIWYLFFTGWLISRSIMLSRSIHAVMKSRSSFFLSAA